MQYHFEIKNEQIYQFLPNPLNPATRGSAKTRNVLTRPERLRKLIADDRWSEGDKVYGMPKVRVAKLSMKKKKKVKKEDEE